jgi:hypothetical protein
MLENQIAGSDAALVASAALSELANLEGRAPERLRYRREAIQVCRRSVEKANSSSLAISLANRVVDLFYDQFVNEERSKINSALASSKRIIADCLGKKTFVHDRVLLLTQRASILRCQSMISQFDIAQPLAQEAVLCARCAVREAADNPYAHLALGEALWSSARVARSDEDYFLMMNRAEKSLLAAAQHTDPMPSFVLSRFYRQTYRPTSAVKTFEEYESKENNRRRLLSQSFVFAEAATQLYYNDYAKETTNSALQKARLLLLEAIDAGYENSRLYVALALIEAAQGHLDSGENTLRALSRESVSSWMQVIEKAVKAIESEDKELLMSAFALGVSGSSLWNSLGTYAAHFLKDSEFARDLYETGRRLNPKNAVILTNLSRVLIMLGDRSSL